MADSPEVSGSNPDLDSHKLRLTADDFRLIDTDSNNRLSLLELTNASNGGKFSGEKQTAVEHLRNELQKAPDKVVDEVHDKHKVIPSWHTADFAMDKLSKEDFKRIDSDKNNVLSNDELKAAKDNKDLAPMSAHAAQVLSNEHSSPTFADTRAIIRSNFINNWHDLDPEFKNVQTSDLLRHMSANVKAVQAGNELIKRMDFTLTPDEVNDSVAAIALIKEALRTNKDIETNAEGKPVISDKPMTDERRMRMHAAVLGDRLTAISGKKVPYSERMGLHSIHAITKPTSIAMQITTAKWIC